MPQKIGILVADDHKLIRVAIRALLDDEDDLALLGEAASFDEAQRLCQELNPDVFLLADNIIDPAPIKRLSSLHRFCPTTRTVILTVDCRGMDWRGLAIAGAAGCILKDEIPESIVPAIHNVAQGGFWFSQAIIQELRLQSDADLSHIAGDIPLTDREVEVLQLVVRGFSSRKIANVLGISERTASFHVSNILEKLGVSSRVEAAVWAKEHGLV